MRISDWSSDVCSSDLMHVHVATSSARDEPNRRGGHGASGGGVNTAPTLRYAAAPNQKTEESRCGASYSGATGNRRSWNFPNRRPDRERGPEERRVGKEGGRTGCCPWSQAKKKDKKQDKI